MGFTIRQLDSLPSQAFSGVSEEFVRMARAFDPKLSGEDIYQAGRNAWTANGLQWLRGLPVEITPSILAYSLLYPYTDNYLDDPAIPVASKRAFNERFRRRLAGEALTTANAQERTIFDLIAMIEQIRRIRAILVWSFVVLGLGLFLMVVLQTWYGLGPLRRVRLAIADAGLEPGG